jgi:hypothetical protein
MPNKRIFYASHAVSVKGFVVHGTQSVGINTNFNLEQVFQLGRLAIYDNIATDPDVEITINKILDGHPTIWKLATTGGSLVQRANDQSTIVLAVDDETQDFIDAPHTAAITMTGCYISSLNYTFPVDGNLTEEIVFVGSHKAVGGTVSTPNADPLDRVLRRQNVAISECTFPTDISGRPKGQLGTDRRLSQISISADLGREKMFSLGQLAPFHRFVNFPLEITVSFDVISDGENQNLLVGPKFDETNVECSGINISKEPIVIKLCDSDGDIAYTFNLGSGCSLQSVSYSGGDTGGGNVTETYTYITYNDLTITG